MNKGIEKSRVKYDFWEWEAWVWIFWTLKDSSATGSVEKAPLWENAVFIFLCFGFYILCYFPWNTHFSFKGTSTLWFIFFFFSLPGYNWERYYASWGWWEWRLGFGTICYPEHARWSSKLFSIKSKHLVSSCVMTRISCDFHGE